LITRKETMNGFLDCKVRNSQASLICHIGINE
jgi:hypothetical protein